MSIAGQIGDTCVHSPKDKHEAKLIGRANESNITFCGVETKALIDSGSQVTTVLEEFLQALPYTPETVDIDDLILKGPDGKSIPYLECIVATVEASFLLGKEIDILAVVVLTTSYHSEVPIVIGTNVIEKCQHLSEDMESVPEV